MADDRWDYDEPSRSRRYSDDEDYERDFRRDRGSRGRAPSASGYPARRYESMPVLGMDLGAARENWPDRTRYDERQPARDRGYTRDNDDSRGEGERHWWNRASDEVRSWMGDVDAERRREVDYRGRGPRGYTRSDERIREDVSDWLMEDRYVDASEIEVSVSGGVVRLAGTVDRRETKRRAENIAANVTGVKDVENSLRVRSASSYGAGAGETSTSASGTSASGNAPGTGTSSTEPRH